MGWEGKGVLGRVFFFHNLNHGEGNFFIRCFSFLSFAQEIAGSSNIFTLSQSFISLSIFYLAN